ncbi:Odorant receptor 51a [Blattella germanica]|nr:Odorant receptor 51a [Blattella germanica]
MYGILHTSLKISGVWCGAKNTMTLSNRLHQRFLLVVMAYAAIGIVMGIYTHSKRFQVVIELVCLSISNLVINLKLYVFIFRSEDFHYVLQGVRTHFFVHDRQLTLENKTIITDILNKVRNLLMVYVSIMTYSSGTFIFITPFVNIYLEKNKSFMNNTETDETPLRILPIQLWLPFDINESPAYELGFLIILITAVVLCIAFTAAEATIISLMVYIIGHYDVFCDSLRNATRNVKTRIQQKNIMADVCEFDSSPKHSEEKKEDNIDCDKDINEVSYNNINDNDGKNITEQIFQQEMEKYLRECVAHHQKLLEFTEKLDQLWEFAFFFQFMTVSLLICFIGFQAMSGPLDANLFKMLGYLVSVLFQIFIYCAFGSNLTAKSAEVFNAVYDTDWYNQNNSYKLITKMMIMRSQKPVFLTAGRFGALCLPLFTSMIRSSYSYLALLRQMQDS